MLQGSRCAKDRMVNKVKFKIIVWSVCVVLLSYAAPSGGVVRGDGAGVLR